jgi:CheY-like chemotaxis protein
MSLIFEGARRTGGPRIFFHKPEGPETAGGGGGAAAPQGATVDQLPGRRNVIRRIVIVEDESLNWGVLSAILSSALRGTGVEVLITSKPSETQLISDQAREIFQSAGLENIDLIVMDGVFASGGGAPIVRDLRNGGYDGLIVAWSSLEEERADLLKAGADFAFSKPINLSEVRSVFTPGGLQQLVKQPNP